MHADIEILYYNLLYDGATGVDLQPCSPGNGIDRAGNNTATGIVTKKYCIVLKNRQVLINLPISDAVNTRCDIENISTRVSKIDAVHGVMHGLPGRCQGCTVTLITPTRGVDVICSGCNGVRQDRRTEHNTHDIAHLLVFHRLSGADDAFDPICRGIGLGLVSEKVDLPYMTIAGFIFVKDVSDFVVKSCDGAGYQPMPVDARTFLRCVKTDLDVHPAVDSGSRGRRPHDYLTPVGCIGVMHDDFMGNRIPGRILDGVKLDTIGTRPLDVQPGPQSKGFEIKIRVPVFNRPVEIRAPIITMNTLCRRFASQITRNLCHEHIIGTAIPGLIVCPDC